MMDTQINLHLKRMGRQPKNYATMSLREATEAAAAAMGKSNSWQVNGRYPGRFYLFNHHLSICSQKTRITMREAGFAFTNVEVPLFNSSNYQAPYVALRLRSWDGKSPFVGEGFGSWNGSSSSTENGFDPCVVPILVDLEANRVVSDSKKICLYAAEVSGMLVPKDKVKAELVEKQISLVDKTPHHALLYDNAPGFDPRPQWSINVTSKGSLHKNQIKALKKHLALEGKAWSDPTIKRAYNAKIQKTTQGLQQTLNTEKGYSGYFDAVKQRTREYLLELEADLKKHPGDWLCGDQITLADVFQGVSLVRIIWAGYESWFSGMEMVSAYARRLTERESVLKESILNPHSGPSQHLAPYVEKHQGKVARIGYMMKYNMIATVTWSWTPTVAMGILAVVIGVVCKEMGLVEI